MAEPEGGENAQAWPWLALALASLVLAGGGAFLLSEGAPSVASDTLRVIVGAVAIAGAGASVAVLIRRGRANAAAGFAALHGRAGAPAALSDDQGRLLLCNPAFGSMATRGRSLGPRLGALTGDEAAGDALVYRLANKALREGVALERRPGPDGRILSIRVGRAERKRQLIWTLTPEPEEPAASHEGAVYAFAVRRTDGEIREANAAFEALGAVDQAAAFAALDEARTEGRGHAETMLPEAGRAIVAAAPLSGGATGALIFPMTALARGAPGTTFFEEAPVALVRLSAAGVIEAMNAAATALLGPDAVENAAFSEVVQGLGRPIGARIAEAAAGRGAGRPDLARATRRDRELYLQIAMKPITGDSHEILAVLWDATDLEAKERQFVQSQKMQAVGQLAGGVAHDFNNLLTAILGHCDLMAMRRDETDPDFGDLTQIRQNANRAAALVRQLLAFSRQQKLDPRACRLPDVMDELGHLFDRLLGERVTLRLNCEPALWPVWVDQRQFEQVILNLVVNARDAMPEGGEVRIDCRNETLREELRRDRAVAPVGDYVRIEITDRGMGMSDETRAKVFEPFFTTKRQGEGTGLGLSTAYGIVKQTGGFIFVDSEPGVGSVFTLLIPRLEAAATPESARERSAQATDLTGAGRVLLVEDEASVRAFAARALRLRGYDVIEAEHAEAALAILDDPAVEVDLVVSDVVMPGLDGPAWVREARRARPWLSVIFTSGYAEDVFSKGLNKIENCSFLAKPFSLEELGVAVKERCPPVRRKESAREMTGAG
ncbi:ATP-binding protein [Pikeienuella sp. HZG-20]|uniref:hybrid sensor histidine kinase/response regulator n=1 Tax=Paludibacillus litoralis TaxID=3133267 RepID=UPI0030EEB223